VFICDLASLAVLFSRLTAYSPESFKNVIPLTVSRGATTVTAATRQEIYGAEQTAAGYGDDAPQIVQLASPGFRTYDKDTVWVSDTKLEIFHLSYDSEKGITVNSENGDKLIAPGTSNEYVFTLENTGDVPLDYDMTMESWITGTDLKLPVKARVHDHTDRYIVGSSSEMVDTDELNTVREHSKLSAGRFAVYTLDWEWPYEWDNDTYDTMLGNMAVNGDIALTIKINTFAAYDETAPKEENGLANPYDPEASPKTGVAMGAVPAVLTGALILMLAVRPRNRKDEEEEQ